MNDTWMNQLDEVLAELAAHGKERERTCFDEAAQGRPVVVYGAGTFGRPIARHLQTNGGRVLCFAVDLPPEAWGTTIDDIPVVSLDDAISRHAGEAVFIPTFFHAYGPRYHRLKTSLHERGCIHVASFLHYIWKFPETFLNYYFVDLPSHLTAQADSIRKVLGLWEDDSSREEYLLQIRYRAHPDREGFPPSGPIPTDYFPTDLFTLNSTAHVIDCGGYTGDTVNDFIQFKGSDFGRLTVFEADSANFGQLVETVKRLPQDCASKIVPHNSAVGAVSGFVEFVNSGYDGSSMVGSRNLPSEIARDTATAPPVNITRVPCVTLDETLKDYPPTFIKMDIEGAEMDALTGASSILRTHAPILAISVYHTQSHLWEIPLFIANRRPGYRFFLRRYSEHPWDTILFAVPGAGDRF